jgi:mannose-6-phosphate isomerase
MRYPLRFQPISVERVWGGNRLARYGKAIPTGSPIGESWEISDRPEANSIVINGTEAGKSLRELVQTYRSDLLGTNCHDLSRFPLLIKLLDARERLSLQVHPPASVADTLRGEPKTEMWYIIEADPQAQLIAGLKRGVTRSMFESALKTRTLESLVHGFPVSAGQSIFIPSGRIHAIDAGLVILEIQQNSDTTYRVYDWGRIGLDGKPRPLHIAESMASIDFSDFEPTLNPLPIHCEHFHTEKLDVTGELAGECDGSTFHILAGIRENTIVLTTAGRNETLHPGELALLPATLGVYRLQGDNSQLIRVSVPAT